MLPDSWQLIKLGEYTSKIGSGITPKGGRATYLFQGIPLIRSQNVLWGTLNLQDVAFISQEQHDKMRATHVRPGDVLLNITGASIGRSCVVPQSITCANVNQHVCIIRTTNSLSSDYLCHYLNSQFGQQQIAMLQAGGNRQGLNFEQVAALKVPLPPLPEQRRIAEILSTWDHAIDLTEQLIVAKQQRKRGLMQELLTGTRRFAEFAGQEWQTKKLNQVFARVTRKNDIGNKNVLTASGFHGLVSQLEYFNRSVAGAALENYYLLQRGEFAYNRSSSDGYPFGAIKQLEEYDAGILSTLYICFRLVDPGSHSAFYKHFFEAGGLNLGIYSIAQEGARNHGLLNVGIDEFFSLDIPVPPTEEQKRLAAVFDALDQDIELAIRKRDLLQQQKQGLMQQLLTEQVRVS